MKTIEVTFVPLLRFFYLKKWHFSYNALPPDAPRTKSRNEIIPWPRFQSKGRKTY